MKNRDQIRARNALKALADGRSYRGVQAGDALSGFPALVINNGLMATLAFSKARGEGYVAICDAIAQHLADADIDLVPEGTNSLDRLLQVLSQGDSTLLRLCTAEGLEYLNFLRRFAKAADRRGNDPNAGGV